MKKRYCPPSLICLRMKAADEITSVEEGMSGMLDYGEEVEKW